MTAERSIGEWRRWWFLLSVILLGIPLGGHIPTAPGITRPQGPSTAYAQFDGDVIASVLVWSLVYAVGTSMLYGVRRSTAQIFAHQPWLTALIVLMLASAAWSPNAQKCVLDALQVLGALAVITGAATSYERRPGRLAGDLSFILGLSQVANVVAVLAVPDAATHPDGRWAGLTGSSNYLGQLSFCAAWASTAASLTDNRGYRGLHLVALIAAVTTLLGTGSISSLTSAIVACVGTVAWTWTYQNRRTRFVRQIALLVVMIWIVGVLAAFGIQDAIVHFLELAGREANFTGRVVIWIGGLQAFLTSPWLGSGFGVDTQSVGVTSWATTFHNGYLELGVKGGTVALLLLVAFVARGLKDMSAATRLVGSSAATWMPFVIGALLNNLTESSFTFARSPVWVVLLALIMTAAAIAVRSKRMTRAA